MHIHNITDKGDKWEFVAFFFMRKYNYLHFLISVVLSKKRRK